MSLSCSTAVGGVAVRTLFGRVAVLGGGGGGGVCCVWTGGRVRSDGGAGDRCGGRRRGPATGAALGRLLQVVVVAAGLEPVLAVPVQAVRAPLGGLAPGTLPDTSAVRQTHSEDG